MYRRSLTLVILKPETIENCIVGSVLKYFDQVGLRPIAMKQLRATKYDMAKHYESVIDRVGDAIGRDILERMTRGPCIFIAYEGVGTDPVIAARSAVGSTDPVTAAEGTIRKEFGSSVQYNVVHASDSPAAAERELKIWFPELCVEEPVYKFDSVISHVGC